MDNGEILQQFVSMFNLETEFALSFLETSGWDLQTAIDLYLGGGGGFGASGGVPPPRAAGGAGEFTSPSFDTFPRFPSPALGNKSYTNEQGGGAADAGGGAGEFEDPTAADEEMARAMSMSELPQDDNAAMYDNSAMYDEEGVRAPIMPKSEVLVEDEPFMRPTRLRPVRAEPNVFDMYRADYRQESLMGHRGGEDQNTKKIKTLADLFRPPVDLMEAGSFDNVKNIANQRKKWLLVNIQEVSEFDCQKMNRDTWADSAVKSVVRSNFVLWQVLKTSEEGARYCRFYPAEIMPHLAIIDSRTGERLDLREGFTEPKDLVIWLEAFLGANSLEDNKAKLVKPRPESPRRVGDVSEEAQLAAAVAASLGKDLSQTEFPTTSSTSTSTTSTTTHTPIHTPAPIKPAPTPSLPVPTPTPVAEPVPTQPPKEEPQPSANLLAEHSSQSTECSCVIQIRMPQSEPIKGFFRPTDTLRTVHQYVSLQMEPKKEFVLVTTFPKKTYSGDLFDMSLKQADLVPRAVLIAELS